MHKRYDLVIFGGGTVGGATFLDAVSRGLKTALVEKSKVGHQTNRNSLGLIQRDPKYLHTDIDLVFMNAVDCGLLKTIARDFLKKQFIIIPHFSDSKYPLWLLNGYIGVLDRFAGLSGSKRHQKLSYQELISREPFLRKDATGGVLYDEWLTDPVELNTVMIQSARVLGGDVFEFFRPVNYFSQSLVNLKRIEKVLIRHELDGKTEWLESAYFVNATGPWAPHFLEFFGLPPFQTRLTKGTSIVINKKLTNNAVILFNKDGKYIAVLPQEDSKTLIGPTNDDVSDDLVRNPDRLLPSEEEVKELLEVASKFFELPLSRKDVFEIRCGLRPQLNHRGVAPDEITHEFVIINHAKRDGITNLYSVFGGKLSNQIRMAKELVDRISFSEWKIPRLRMKKGWVKLEHQTGQPAEKLYAKKFALSFENKIGQVALGKKVKSLLFVGWFVFKGLLREMRFSSFLEKGENHVR